MNENAVFLIPFAVYGICVLAYQVGCLLNNPTERPKIEPSDGKNHIRPWYYGDFGRYILVCECKECESVGVEDVLRAKPLSKICGRCGLNGVEYAGYRKWNGVEWKLPEKKDEVKE